MVRPAKRVKKPNGLGAALTPSALAVMRAFNDARHHAPGFVVSCGVLPEVSEAASDRLHSIVRDIAERRLDARRHMRAVHTGLSQLPGRRSRADQIERHLNAVLGSEVTAAYLFGLAVGLAINGLPDRLLRRSR